jgi:hypothetical protein
MPSASPAFDGLGQGEENGLGFLERIDDGFVPKHCADPRTHHCGVQRFEQKFIGARGEAGNFVLDALYTGEHQDRHELGSAVRLEPAAERRPAHFGKHEVNDDKVDGFALDEPNRIGSAAALEDSVGSGL